MTENEWMKLIYKSVDESFQANTELIAKGLSDIMEETLSINNGEFV